MGVLPVAPALSGPVISRQQWRNLLFLHWPVDPAEVAPFFPPGTRPDVVDGRTYAGLVPFRMRKAGPGERWSVPYVGDFLETNVRLYSIDDAGRHGILFLTLEAERLATVLLARLSLGLPYTWARMREDTGAPRTFTSRRRWPGGSGVAVPRSTITFEVGKPTEPVDLEIWLTARWGLHTRRLGRTWWVPNQHGPWPLRSAEIVALDETLLFATGVRPIGPALRPLFSSGVETTFGLPRQLGRATDLGSS